MANAIQLLIRFCRSLLRCQSSARRAKVSYAIAIPSMVRFEAWSRMPSTLARVRSAISRHLSALLFSALLVRQWAIGEQAFDLLSGGVVGNGALGAVR